MFWKKIFTIMMFLVIFGLTETFAGQFFYCLNDHLGTTRVIVDEAGAVKEFNDYYPFGKIRRSQIADLPVGKYKFTGKELDDENGLDWYDFGARYYDASIGRWLVPDPLAKKYPQWSPYTYCHDNPINRIDPDGTFVGTVTGGIVGGVFGGATAALKGTNVWAGIVGGATSGVIAGAAVDITIATGGSAAVLIGAATLGGAVGNTVGDFIEQTGNNLSKGASLHTAISEVNKSQLGLNAAIGAASGLIGGSVGVVLQKGASSTTGVIAAGKEQLKNVSQELIKQGANDATTLKVQKDIVNGIYNAAVNTANNCSKVEITTNITTQISEKVISNLPDPEKEKN